MSMFPVFIIAAIAIAAGVYFFLLKKKNNTPPPPPPGTRAFVSMDPLRWNFQASPGMLPSPTSDGSGWKFEFPHSDGVHYLVHPTTGFIAGTFKARFSVEKDASAKFIESDPCGDHRASCRLYFQRRGDDLTAEKQDYRWWSVDQFYLDNDGRLGLSVPLDPDKWSQVFGSRGDTRVGAFNAAAADIQAVGITFGGCFAGHGAYVTGGNATFKMVSYTIE